ncbi:reverse transcriptase domain-containing protein [Tanacetum coccineum]|uniref:Reverse transcriptase domain-containing protein n=1 Tax=Tanacetum coccineum TaxID=301880 RepID=A0ABQ4XAI1_9ASTR
MITSSLNTIAGNSVSTDLRKLSKSLDLVQDPTHLQLAGPTQQAVQEKLKAVKARLNFEEISQHSESGGPSRRRDVRKRLGPKDVRNMSRSPEPRRDRSRSPRRKDPERETVFRRLEKAAETPKAIIRIPAHEEWSPLLRGIMIEKHTHVREKGCQKVKTVQEDIGKLKSKKQKSSMEDEDLSQPWVCEETGQFTPRIRYFDLPKRIRMPSHDKTYDGSEDPEDHLKIFQSVAKVERWAMPTWCHMFNSTLTENARVWFDDLLPESINSYDDLKEAFLVNYLQQKKGTRSHENLRIHAWNHGFMHGITNPELIKRLHDKIPKSVDEMWKITTPFLRGEVAAGNQEWKKTFPPWRQQDAEHRQNFKKRGFKNQQRSEKRQDRFALFSKTPKEILALEKVNSKLHLR